MEQLSESLDMLRIQEASMVFDEVSEALETGKFRKLSESWKNTLRAFNFQLCYDLEQCKLYRSKHYPSLRILLIPHDEASDTAAIFYPLNRVEQIIVISYEWLIFDIFNHEFQHFKTFLKQKDRFRPMRALTSSPDEPMTDLSEYINDHDEMNSYLLEELGAALEDAEEGKFDEFAHLDHASQTREIVLKIFRTSSYHDALFSKLTSRNKERFLKRLSKFVDRYITTSVKDSHVHYLQ